MNEQRLQTYNQLIQTLLNCPSGEEPEILAANTELLDADFVQVVAAAAEHFAQQGEENTAERLRNLATYLTTPETTPITQEDIDTCGQFLLEILQATAESKGDAQVIYPLLAANTDKLNHIFAELLRRWATNTLAEAEPDRAEYIAYVMFKFSNLIQQFPLGSKANNMEIAIAGYEIVLTVYTRSAFPESWAMTQYNLGNVYFDRILGERAENLESVIAAFSAALEVYTCSAFPEYWAMTQNNLGSAYANRILGERAENIESAIAAFCAALEVYTRSAFPVNWAMTQNNLGLAYANRILGERAENIESAIAAYTAALEVKTRSAFPVDWAMTQNNLGVAYADRILGERVKNLESAIAAYTVALEVRTCSAFPGDWAATQYNLGNVYFDRILGERAENIESAIAAYTAALKVYTRSVFPENWAMAQNNLGVAYANRILGERAENIKSAIAAFSAALEVRTRSAFPVDWAATQYNLGAAYANRILGERADNIEKAIAAFSAALEVRTRSAFPVDWAATQYNLGNAYLNRILGERAENLESAIAAYTAALEVRTRSAFSEDWAATQNDLGNAYSNRILGERAENLEKAIAAYTAALEVRTCSAFPEDWATTQNNLGNAYLNRILGERAENLESAITAYTEALKVRTRSAFPEDWAGIQNNLGNAYLDRILGERAENLESAIAAYTEALKVRTRSAFPEDWATTQNNLGNAYSNRKKGEPAENIESAIAAYTEALEVRTRSAFPVDCAATQNNLGAAYLNRKKGEPAENIESAIAAFYAALEVRTRSAFPVDWAETQNNLGAAYADRIKGKRAENIESMIAAFYAALEVLTRSAFPQKHAQTLLNLGILYQNEKQFNLAYNTFIKAIETVENLRLEIVSGEEAKRKQAEEWNRLYIRMIKVCLALGRDTEAIEYIERSKTRNLVELLTKATLASPENLPLVGNSIYFSEIQNLLDNETAIIEWYIFNDCFRAFIITCNNNKPAIWHSSQQDLDALIHWTNEYLRDYYKREYQDKIQWQNQLKERLKKLAEILHLEEILNLVSKQCDRLILIPHLFLHLLPLHALPVKESYLIDLFPNGVGYAPSCQLLQQLQLRQRSDFQSFFAIKNPTKDLYQKYEKDLGAVAAIKKQFTDTKILKQEEAKKSAILLAINENPHNVTLHEKLLKANCAFFFCHGYFNFTSPQDSGLQLADEDLTLADIITHFKLENCRLVTLSACETGLTDLTSTSDEYIGLPSAFLLAGSTNVVSSLWTVSATATALLMIKFYEELQQQINIVLALNTAQRWLRNTSVQEFRAWLRESNLDEDWQDELDEQFLQIEQQQGSTTKIFESPFYWSAFCAIGKGF
ncbi:CHAT domain-containing tetratricopeptide repeat protein [Nostoc sp.]|uniref:CHAT domain-containing tetratricopeptide repeat protein n=1 Tax=Nostoc sp. TaxID=1180 RepID=UPI002FF780D9